MTNGRTKRVDISLNKTQSNGHYGIETQLYGIVSNGCCKARMKARPEVFSSCCYVNKSGQSRQ